MGFIKKAVQSVQKIGGKLADPAKFAFGIDGAKEIGKVVGDFTGANQAADATRAAAATQADATRAAAESQAAQTKAASDAQTANVQAQAQATANSINQSTLAAQTAASMVTATPEAPAKVDLTGPASSDANDPRRKYQGGGSSIGGSSGGVGIRLS